MISFGVLLLGLIVTLETMIAWICMYSSIPRDIHNRGVARGEGAGGPEPPRNLADQLTVFKPCGADYARYTTASPPLIQNAIHTSK